MRRSRSRMRRLRREGRAEEASVKRRWIRVVVQRWRKTIILQSSRNAPVRLVRPQATARESGVESQDCRD